MSKESTTERCCGKVRGSAGGGWFRPSSPCKRRGKVQRDGKWYCGTHDPVAKKERNAKRSAAWEAEWAAKVKAYENRAKADRLTQRIVEEQARRGDADALWVCELRGWKP